MPTTNLMQSRSVVDRRAHNPDVMGSSPISATATLPEVKTGRKEEGKMTRYADIVSPRKTPQRQKARADQVKNDAGGYVFSVDCWCRLERFLILGAEGGTYYSNERKLVLENYESLEQCLAEDGMRTVKTIVDISVGGRAPKNDPAIFALAVAAGSDDAATRKAALDAVPEVCRIGTHLFDFLNSVQEFRGWGRGLRRSVASWYLNKNPHRLGLQVAKYRQRNGWTHRDVLRKCGGEITDTSEEQQAILRWVVSGIDGMGERTVKRGEFVKVYPAIDPETLPRIILGYERCKAAESAREAAKIVADYRLTHEMVPSQYLKSKEVWEALLQSIPVGALVRNLGRLTALGLMEPFSDGLKRVEALLTDATAIKKARLHPMSALKAMHQYAKGRGDKGSLTWTPNARVRKAVEAAFYLGFDAIEPTGLNTILALDVSASMTWPENKVKGMAGLTSRDCAAAMAMVTARVEPNYHIMAFSDSLVPLDISKSDDLHSVIHKMQNTRMGGTDASLPMRWATGGKIPVDVFHIYTDHQTWHGPQHVHQSLNDYRHKMGRYAKMATVCFGSSGFSLADPNDPGMLDFVGFDTSAPAVMADFARTGYGE